MFCVSFCVHVCAVVGSRGCGKADNEGNTEVSKSDLTFPCEQSQIPTVLTKSVCVRSWWQRWGVFRGLHFNQENGRVKKASTFRALVTILSSW